MNELFWLQVEGEAASRAGLADWSPAARLMAETEDGGVIELLIDIPPGAPVQVASWWVELESRRAHLGPLADGSPNVVTVRAVPDIEGAVVCIDGVERIGLTHFVADAMPDTETVVALSGLPRGSNPNCRRLAIINAWGVDLADASAWPLLEHVELDGCEEILGWDDLPEKLLTLRVRRAGIPFWALERFLQLEHLESDASEWPTLADLEPLLELRRLSLKGCGDLHRMSDLAPLPSLTDLTLRGASTLRCIETLSGLRSLVANGLAGTNLEAIAKLPALRFLSLNLEERKYDLRPIAKCSNLVRLELENCEGVSDFAPAFGLKQLASLSLSYAEELQDLSPIASLRNLRRLSLPGTTDIASVDALAALPNLSSVALGSVSRLEPLGALPLRTLEVGLRDRLDNVSALAGLRQLRELRLSGCGALEDLGPLSALPDLRSLWIKGASRLRRTGEEGGWKNLTAVMLHNLPADADISGLAPAREVKVFATKNAFSLAGFTQLEALSLTDVTVLPDITPLAPTLRSLRLEGCDGPIIGALLRPLTALRHLYLDRCLGLDLREAGDLSLRVLRTAVIANWAEEATPTDEAPASNRALEGLQAARGLRALIFDACERDVDLDVLGEMTSLCRLSVPNCEGLRSVDALARLVALREVEISGSKRLKRWPSLAALPRLRRFRADGAELSRVLDGTGAMEQLEWIKVNSREGGALGPAAREALSRMTQLRIIGAHVLSLEDLPIGGGLASLRVLKVKGKDRAHFARVATLTELERLTVRGDESSDLSFLQGLPKLRTLELSGWGPDARAGTRDLKVLTALPALRVLEIDESWFDDPAGLGACSQLRQLKIKSACRGTVLAREIGAPRGLRVLELSDATLLCLEGLDRLHALEIDNLPLKGIPLPPLPRLRSLVLHRAKQLEELTGIANASCLLEFKIYGGPRLTRTAGLLACRKLETVELADAPFVRDVDLLGQLPWLRELQVANPVACAEALARSAVTRGDAELVDAHRADWVDAVGLVDAPVRLVNALVPAFLAFRNHGWFADASISLAVEARRRTDGERAELDHALWTSILQLADELTTSTTKPATIPARATRWMGWLEQNGRRGWRAVWLRIAEEGIEGAGVDGPGAFRMQGNIEGDRVAWITTYAEGGSTVQYDGTLKDDVLEGKWRIRVRGHRQDGTFHFQRVPEGTPDGGSRGRFFDAAAGGPLGVEGARNILGPVLIALSRPGLPDSFRPFARWFGERALEPWTEHAIARELAPAAAVFRASLGDEAGVRAWLARATSKDAPIWRDRVVLALTRWDRDRGDIASARRRLRDIHTPALQDEARADIARYLAEHLPAEVAAEVDAIKDAERRALVATDLAGMPIVTAIPANVISLLLALEMSPERLATFLEQLIAAHPESAFVHAVAEHFAPPPAAGSSPAGLRDAVETILASPAITRNTKRAQLDKFAARVTANPHALDRILLEGVARALQQEGLLDSEELDDVLASPAPSTAPPAKG